MSIEDRYGCTLRIYDNGGKTADRYTCLPPRWSKGYMHRGKWIALAASGDPFHPLGFGQYCTAAPGPHLGKRIHWDQLPTGVQAFARQSFPEYCPPLQSTAK